MPLFRFFTYALAGYATLVGIMFFGQRKLMYHGGATVPTPAEYGVPDMRPVGLATADGLELLAWYRAPTDEALPTIIYYHGNAGHIGNRADKVRPYLDAGFGVLLVAYRGYSGNPGTPSEPKTQLKLQLLSRLFSLLASCPLRIERSPFLPRRSSSPRAL